MGLTLIEAAKHETRVERLAAIRTFSEGQLIRRLPLRCLTGAALKFAHGKELPSVGIRAMSEGNRQDYGTVVTKTGFAYLLPVQPLTQELTMSFPWTCAAQQGRICCTSGQKFAQVATRGLRAL